MQGRTHLISILMLAAAMAGCADDRSLVPTDGPDPLRPPHFPNDGSYEYLDIELDSVIGHKIPVSIYRPTVASNETPVPVLLHSHGFTGSRWSGDEATPYVAAGFGVVSFDERGHGDAKDDSEVTFMHPDAEVQDVITVIDHIASLDWVLKDPADATDPVLGTIGGSYGGAFQTMTAVFDDRIDAMVPEITWHSIVQALAPNGAINSGWVDLFYVAGNAQQSVVFSQDFHLGFLWAVGTNELPAGEIPGVVPDLVTLLTEASPASYPGAIDVPTLFIQGMPDTLFNLNHAVANYHMVNATGAPVALYTHLEGHIAPGLQGTGGGYPCGELTDLNIAWHQQWLLHLDTALENQVCIALEDGSTVVGDTYPLPETRNETIDVGGPFPMAQAVGGTLIPLTTITTTEEMVIAGIPRLTGSITSPGADSIVYFSFQRHGSDLPPEHIVNDQVMPLRTKGPNTGAVDFTLDLGGIGTRLAAGDELVLVASSIEPMYFGNSERIPAGIVLDGLELQLPVVESPVSGP